MNWFLGSGLSLTNSEFKMEIFQLNLILSQKYLIIYNYSNADIVWINSDLNDILKGLDKFPEELLQHFKNS